jgi:uncharacterized caspase-like protein
MGVRGLFGSLKFGLLAGLILACQPALAEKRVALVLGNSAYQNVPPLANPVNDAALMADTFKKAGFDQVELKQNLTVQETRRALREFADKSNDADIAVIYYAGHGIEVDGGNYLIPVDAKLERDDDVYDEAFSLDRILATVEPAKRLRLVILDACRDNPFAQKMKKSLATRAIGRGLAKVEPASPNTLIAYSAKAGSTAQDGAGKDSPFTAALANHLTTPGLDIRRAFGFVRDDVLKTTNNRQEPYVYGSLGGDDVPLVPNRSLTPPAAPAPDAQADIRRDYELALQVGNRGAFEAFLAQHHDGFYANLAKLQLDKIAADQAHTAAVEKSRQADQERDRLAAEGAKKETQAKAEADAKAAEQARIAAENAQQVAQQQAADAERKRVEPAAVPANQSVPASRAPENHTAVAALDPAPSQADLAKSVQSELRRVGCYGGNADGNWDQPSQRSLSQFNRSAGTRLDVKTVNADTLDAIKQKPSRVCPLACEHGFKADGDHCTRIVCAEGSFVNDDNECEKRRGKATVKRDDDDRPAPRPRDRQTRSARGGSPYDGGYGDAPPRQRGGSSYYNSPPQQGSRPLTGLERAVGCNTPGAIMSGKCP